MNDTVHYRASGDNPLICFTGRSQEWSCLGLNKDIALGHPQSSDTKCTENGPGERKYVEGKQDL